MPALADAIKGLLGLDLVGRLQSDLSIYTGRLPKSGATRSLKKELKDLDRKIQSLKDNRLKLVASADKALSRQDRVRQQIARADRKVTQVGGGFADEREELKAEETRLTHQVSEIEKQIRELCSGLMPFTFAADLCIAVRDHIESEKTLQEWQIHQDILLGKISKRKGSLEKSLFPPSEKVRISQQAKERIVGRAQRVLENLGKPPKGQPKIPVIHRFSEDSRKMVLTGLQRIIDEIPGQVGALEGQLEVATRRLHEVRAALKKIPEDDVLQPLIKTLNDLHRKLGDRRSGSKTKGRGTSLPRSSA